MNLPKLYTITDTTLSGLSHPEQVEALCAGGATLIQLREKQAPDNEFYPQAKEALLIARRHHATLIINDRIDIAAAIGADGVHLGQNDLPPDSARKLLPTGAIIGLSTHNDEQIRTALTMALDYIAIGPIFHTFTKTRPEAAVGLEGVRTARRLAPKLPIVAIGGIDLQTAQSVLAAGADSVAVIGWLMSKQDEIVPRLRLFLASQ